MKKLTKKQIAENEKLDNIATLIKVLAGATKRNEYISTGTLIGNRWEYKQERVDKPIIYMNLLSVSRSGMSRHISFFCISATDGSLYRLDPLISQILGYRLDNGLVVSGCGMDMGFHVVSQVAYTLYKNDYAISYQWIN